MGLCESSDSVRSRDAPQNRRRHTRGQAASGGRQQQQTSGSRPPAAAPPDTAAGSRYRTADAAVSDSFIPDEAPPAKESPRSDRDSLEKQGNGSRSSLGSITPDSAESLHAPTELPSLDSPPSAAPEQQGEGGDNNSSSTAAGQQPNISQKDPSSDAEHPSAEGGQQSPKPPRHDFSHLKDRGASGGIVLDSSGGSAKSYATTTDSSSSNGKGSTDLTPRDGAASGGAAAEAGGPAPAAAVGNTPMIPRIAIDQILPAAVAAAEKAKMQASLQSFVAGSSMDAESLPCVSGRSFRTDSDLGAPQLTPRNSSAGSYAAISENIADDMFLSKSSSGGASASAAVGPHPADYKSKSSSSSSSSSSNSKVPSDKRSASGSGESKVSNSSQGSIPNSNNSLNGNGAFSAPPHMVFDDEEDDGAMLDDSIGVARDLGPPDGGSVGSSSSSTPGRPPRLDATRRWSSTSSGNSSSSKESTPADGEGDEKT